MQVTHIPCKHQNWQAGLHPIDEEWEDVALSANHRFETIDWCGYRFDVLFETG
jgi:hypothetical protein